MYVKSTEYQQYSIETFVTGSFQWNRQCKLVVVTIVVLHFVRLHTLDTVFNAEFEGNCWTSTTTTVPLFNKYNTTITTISVIMTVFQVYLGQSVPSRCSSSTCSGGKPLGMWHRFFWGWMPFLPPNQQCRSPEENSKLWLFVCSFFSVRSPAYSRLQRVGRPKHWPQSGKTTQWSHPFFIYLRTLDRKGTATCMVALWCQQWQCLKSVHLKITYIMQKWVKILRLTRHKIGYFGDVHPSQSLGILLKKLNITQQNHTYTNKL